MLCVQNMDNVELSVVANEELPNASVLAPSEEDLCPPQSDAADAFSHFSHLTPSKFGISTQSFTPLSSSNRKDKSRLAQLKARRRSNIGVRGSPETNSLIRFVAQQRSKTPPASQSIQLVTNSPFLPRRASTLRQKMASFQSLMDVEESGVCHPASKQDGDAGGCIKTRDYLSDGGSLDEEKENHPSLSEPPQSKRRRHAAPLRGCELQISGSDTPTLHLSRKQQQVATRAAPDEAPEQARALLLSVSESDPETPPALVDPQPPVSQQESVFALQSSDAPAAAQPARPSFHARFLAQPEMKSTEGDDSAGTSVVKKKRVRFGGPLSPELFDRNLPPSTPLQRGSTPARAPTPGGALLLLSALKTPQRSERRTPQAQLDLCSPSAFGASPTFAMPQVCRVREGREEDGAEMCGAITFPSMEDIDCDVTAEAEPPCSPLLVNLNAAFHEEAETLSECPTDPPPQPEAVDSVSLQDEDECERPPETLIQPHKASEAPGPSSHRKRKAGPRRESGGKAPSQPSSRKRKQPDDGEPAKRSTRSAAVSASGKMRATSQALRRWNKDVDRSLYGSRAYASKNPVLSPITESLLLAGHSPAAPLLPPSQAHAALNQTPQLNCPHADEPISSEDLLDNAKQDALEAPTEPSTVSPTRSKGSRARGRRRRDSSRARKEVTGRGRKGRKSGEDPQAQPETEGQIGESCQDQTAQLEELKQNSSDLSVPDDGVFAFSECPSQSPANAPGTRMKVPASADPPQPLGEESSDATSLPAEREMESAQRNSQSESEGSSIMGSGRVEEHQNSRDAEEERFSQQENSSCLSADVQEGQKEGSGCLAPWQADFNFEDVFKPVATRGQRSGQRSVRRSLRNQNGAEQSDGTSGLAWLPWTSPESSKGSRRRTRGRPAPLEYETPQ
ncbi:cell division cycle-associated protein 2 [Genypterus blacodes]|uniref:cell division cycle-associated protein 2 n=1 Tax=Genypterus blacodes TaxID=154954 RepID=UPI003F7758F6